MAPGRATTSNVDRFAVEATDLSLTNPGEGRSGGLWANGGDGTGVVASSPIGVPTVMSIGDTYFVEGHEASCDRLAGVIDGVLAHSRGPAQLWCRKTS